MSRSRRLGAALVLLPLIGCAGLQDDRAFAPLDAIEPGAGPLDPADAAAAEASANAIMSAVIAGDLLIGGQAATEMLRAAAVEPAVGPDAAPADADDAATAAEARQLAALEQVALAQEPERQRQLRQALLLERWMSTRVEPVRLDRDDIRRGQQLLAERGFDPGPIDGIVGPRTRAAVAAFQDAQSLPVTGELTRALLELLTITG